MASSSSSRQANLFLVAAILCLICIRGQAVRPQPGSSDRTSQGSASTAAHQKSGPGIGTEMDQEEQEATRGCEVGEGAEECLMRRTLVAHTDYIYTQGKHH